MPVSSGTCSLIIFMTLSFAVLHSSLIRRCPFPPSTNTPSVADEFLSVAACPGHKSISSQAVHIPLGSFSSLSTSSAVPVLAFCRCSVVIMRDAIRNCTSPCAVALSLPAIQSVSQSVGIRSPRLLVICWTWTRGSTYPSQSGVTEVVVAA